MQSDPTAILQIIETADGSSTLHNSDLSETYHSKFGAITESLDVFIKNSGVRERLENRQATRVLEIGFGTGLNFILTAGLATEHQSPLYYEAFEYALPPSPLVIELLQKNTPDYLALIKDLQHALQHDLTAKQLQIGDYCQLKLRLEDALAASLDHCLFNAIYLDAFSTKNNPDLWTPTYLNQLHRVLDGNGILTTYSVNRAFRDALTEAGFLWEKRRGPPGKREVVIAYRK